MATAHKFTNQPRLHRLYELPVEMAAPAPDATIQMIDVNDIEVPSYQRDIAGHKLKIMIRDWDPQKAGYVLLSLRADGNLYVVDGQHRVEAVRNLQGKIGPYIAAIVREGMTSQEEASFFALQSKKYQTTLKPEDVHKAMLEAGDVEALSVNRIAASCGYHIGAKGRHAGTGRIKAVSALYDIQEQYGPNHLDETLAFVAITWGTETPPTHTLLMGVALFYAMFPDANGSSLSKTAGKDSIEAFTRRCREHANSMKLSAPEGVAGWMHTVYNRRNSKKPLMNFEERLRDHKATLRSQAAKQWRGQEGANR